MNSVKPAPALKYPGSKWNLGQWICGHFPPHSGYVEPFFGSGSAFFNKERTRLEVLNDLDKRVVNLFRVIRDRSEELAALVEMTPWAREEYELSYRPPTGDDLEDARSFLIRCWQANGTRLNTRSGWRNQTNDTVGKCYTDQWRGLPKRIRATADRLKGAMIECRPAVDVIERHAGIETLLYVDPPYPLSTRNGKYYAHEMTDADHEDLLELLLKHPGTVVISGYRCELYDDLLHDWTSVSAPAVADGGRGRTEVLWISPTATEALGGRLF